MFPLYRKADKTHARKYKIGQQQEIHAEADAGNTIGPHDETPHGGGRRRRPPHIMWLANMFSMCPRMYFLVFAYIVLSAFGYIISYFWAG